MLSLPYHPPSFVIHPPPPCFIPCTSMYFLRSLPFPGGRKESPSFLSSSQMHQTHSSCLPPPLSFLTRRGGKGRKKVYLQLSMQCTVAQCTPTRTLLDCTQTQASNLLPLHVCVYKAATSRLMKEERGEGGGGHLSFPFSVWPGDTLWKGRGEGRKEGRRHNYPAQTTLLGASQQQEDLAVALAPLLNLPYVDSRFPAIFHGRFFWHFSVQGSTSG